MRLPLAIAALACIVVAADAGAQSDKPLKGEAAAGTTAMLRARADSLLVMHKKATRALEARRAEDSLRVLTAGPMDDDGTQLIAVGPLRILADTEFAAVAEKAAGDVLPILDSIFGSQTRVFEKELWRIRSRRDTAEDGSEYRHTIVLAWVRDGQETYHTSALAGYGNLREFLFVHFMGRGESWMSRARVGPAKRWLDRFVGAGGEELARREGVFRELAIGKHPLGPGCRAGNIELCIAALAIEPGGTAVDTLSSNARASLFMIAIEVGGRDAYTRFIADTARSIAGSLEAASGMPVSTLVARWRKLVLDARPAPASTPPRAAITAMLWGIVLCGVSLRSSRWR